MPLHPFVVAALFSLPLAGQAPAGLINAPDAFTLQILASDSTKFIDEWVSTPPSHAVGIHRIRALRRGRTAHIAFIVAGPRPGADGRSHVGVSVRVRRPDGSVAFSDARFARVRWPNSGRRGFVMADPTLEFDLEDTDPLGPWLIEATALDSVSRATSSARDTLQALR
jgi:hypothetical protein